MVISASGFYFGKEEPTGAISKASTIIQTESGDIIASLLKSDWRYRFKRNEDFIDVFSIRPEDNREFSEGRYSRK